MQKTKRVSPGVEHEGGCERRVAAEVYLPARRKPAQTPDLALPDGEGGLREVVLDGDGLHERVLRPFVHDADRRGIALKEPLREGVNVVALHLNPSKNADTAL